MPVCSRLTATAGSRPPETVPGPSRRRPGVSLRASLRAIPAAAVVLLALSLSACSDDDGDTTQVDSATQAVLDWNQVAIDASGIDHTPVGAGENRVFGEQVGPGRASRAMAIAHIAMFEAVNAVEGGYTSYVGLAPHAGRVVPASLLAPAHDEISIAAAVAQAGHDALYALFPSQRPAFDQHLAQSLAGIPGGAARDEGIALGQAAAAAILAMRAGDGSAHPEPRVGVDFTPGTAPGWWRPDPVSQHPLALGARWAEVTPFALNSASQFRCPPPPPLGSAAYAEAFNEAKRLGGDGVHTPTERSVDQGSVGTYWAYDGTPSLCAPPRLYNQLAVTIALDRGTSAIELARLLALVNVAMADAGIASWESKYHYQFWRPVTGIREADDDGNPDTIADPGYMPMGAPASNATGPNFTPPFPAYPSGHATFGGAIFQVLRRYYDTDRVPFTFVSDEYNGVTKDNQGKTRAYHPRHYSNLSDPEEENGQSRIYLGIHWSFDKTEGIIQGRKVGNLVFDTLFRPATS